MSNHKPGPHCPALLLPQGLHLPSPAVIQRGLGTEAKEQSGG